MKIQITSFYIFDKMSQSQVETRVQTLKDFGRAENLKGLILVGTEGFNLTVSGSQVNLQNFKNLFIKEWNYSSFLCKDSESQKHPFKHFRVQVRPEIVTLGVGDIDVVAEGDGHVSPQKWQELMGEEDVVILDTRNWYETEIGKFKNAVEFDIKEFRDFPEALKKSEFDKDKKYLIYCTGGIRCEKAIVEMHRQGFNKVYQLEGGILKYIEAFPERDFNGECFVFDHRVALDQKLQPSQKYRLCPHCGQPGTLKIQCLRCDHDSVICSNCNNLEYNRTCSKNCAHHYKVRPGQKGPHQDESTY